MGNWIVAGRTADRTLARPAHTDGWRYKLLIKMVPERGIEPTIFSLRSNLTGNIIHLLTLLAVLPSHKCLFEDVFYPANEYIPGS